MAEQEERIAARLKKLRADLGHPDRPGQPLPADQAAETAKVKYRQWQRWEQGRTMPTSKNLEKVAAAFKIDVAEFYATDEDDTPSQLDRIEGRLDQIYTLLTGTTSAPDAGDAKRVVDETVAQIGEAVASRRKPSPGQRANPRATRRRSGA